MPRLKSARFSLAKWSASFLQPGEPISSLLKNQGKGSALDLLGPEAPDPRTSRKGIPKACLWRGAGQSPADLPGESCDRVFQQTARPFRSCLWLGTVSLEDSRRIGDGPQIYQFYFHKDRGLNRDMMARAQQAGVEVMMQTVDSITGGNRERDQRTGFAIPFKLNLSGISQFTITPTWAINDLTHERL